MPDATDLDEARMIYTINLIATYHRSLSMQRSLTHRAILVWLALGVALACGMPARAGASTPITFAARVEAGSLPAGYHSIASARPGDAIMYTFELSPSVDPAQRVTLSIDFDQRLSYYTVGTNGACVGPNANNQLVCTDPYNDSDPLAQFTIVWVWFTVKPSSDRSPLITHAGTADQDITLSIDYDLSNQLTRFLPMIVR